MKLSSGPLFIILACALWASDLVVRYPISLKMSYANIVLVESFFGLMILLPWLFKFGINEFKNYSPKDWILSTFLGGIGMTVAGLLFTYCIQKATPGTFSFFQVFQPFLVIFLSNKFLKDKFDNMYFFWGIWVVLSALLMYSQDIELALIGGDLFSYPLETLVALSVMLIWGLCTVAAKVLLKKHSPISVVTARWFFAFGFALVFSLLNKVDFSEWRILYESEYLWRFIYISLVAGIASMSLYYHSLKSMETMKVSFIELSYPALGMVFSAFYTFNQLTFLQAVGFISFIIFITMMISGNKILSLITPSTRSQQSRLS